jgi:integrase
MRKPYFKKSHKSWFVELNRKQINLGKDKEQAFQEYHRLMAEYKADIPVSQRATVAELVEQFLAWNKASRAPRTYDWYLAHCQSFVKFVGPKLKVSEVKPNHATRWLAKSYKNSGNTHQNGACRAISRAFNWAKKQGLIPANPLTGMERPAAEPREAYLSPAQWATMIALVKPNDPFADLLWFMRETGCRPEEVRRVEADHWDAQNRRMILERKKSKGKIERRVIRLNDHATEIITRLAKKYPEGLLFRNKRGTRWTGYALNNRYDRIGAKVDFEVFPYILRHAWCTDALLRDVDPLTVAILLGHKDATMVMKVYSHLTQNDDFLQQKLKQATGEIPKASSA